MRGQFGGTNRTASAAKFAANAAGVEVDPTTVPGPSIIRTNVMWTSWTQRVSNSGRVCIGVVVAMSSCQGLHVEVGHVDLARGNVSASR